MSSQSHWDSQAQPKASRPTVCDTHECHQHGDILIDLPSMTARKMHAVCPFAHEAIVFIHA